MMTTQKHLKHLVRDRMEKTGERYAAARRKVLAHRPHAAPDAAPGGAASAHLAGRVPATTALRILLNGLGHSWTEPQLFAAAGGIGAGVFSFLYEKEDFVSLYVAGRHKWYDELDYLKSAAVRVGARPVVKEAAAATAGLKQLREALDGGRPVIAWVDAAHLPHRKLPPEASGGAYHLITIYAIDGDVALIGDLAPEPIELSLHDLAQARGRIRKQKHRLLWLEPERKVPQSRAITDGIAACVKELTTCRMKNYRLDAFGLMGDRMAGGKSKESWERMFPGGKRLRTALTSLDRYIEHYGTGGGLFRPIFAEGLASVGRTEAARAYAELGRLWSGLAESAREGLERFPKTLAQAQAVRLDLQRQTRAIYQAELDALKRL